MITVNYDKFNRTTPCYLCNSHNDNKELKMRPNEQNNGYSITLCKDCREKLSKELKS